MKPYSMVIVAVPMVRISDNTAMDFIGHIAGRCKYCGITEHDYNPAVYSPSVAANIAVRKAIARSGDNAVIIKTDVDCRLTDSFLTSAMCMQHNTAIAPYIQFQQEDGSIEHNPNPCGTVAMHAADWMRLCGYDERMYGHGAEDWDIIRRAMAIGIKVVRPLTGVMHKWHTPRINPDTYPRRRRENLDIIDNMPPWRNEQWGTKWQ